MSLGTDSVTRLTVARSVVRTSNRYRGINLAREGEEDLLGAKLGDTAHLILIGKGEARVLIEPGDGDPVRLARFHRRMAEIIERLPDEDQDVSQ